MIPYQLDPTLHTAPPAPAELGDGFSPVTERSESVEAPPQELAGVGLDQAPSPF